MLVVTVPFPTTEGLEDKILNGKALASNSMFWESGISVLTKM